MSHRKRVLLIWLLSLGAVIGFGSSCARHFHHHHGHGDAWSSHYAYGQAGGRFMDRVAEHCVRAARSVSEGQDAETQAPPAAD